MKKVILFLLFLSVSFVLAGGLIPHRSTDTIGTSGNPWGTVYATNIMINGTNFSAYLIVGNNAFNFTNFPPIVVQTNATDVMFARWRFAEHTGTRSLIQPALGDGYLLATNAETAFYWGINGVRGIYDAEGNYVLHVLGCRRTLVSSNLVTAADWTQDTFRVGPNSGTNLPVYSILTNILDRLNTAGH
jgi:hypothetical protein